MVKIRLWGEFEEIQETAKEIMKNRKVLKKGKAQKDTRGETKYYRLYMEVE